MLTSTLLVAVSTMTWPTWTDPPVPPRAIALRIGVSPEALAASGVDSSVLAAIFSRLEDARGSFNALDQAQASAAAAAGTIARLQDEIAHGGRTPERESQLEKARDALAEANGSAATHTGALWEAATNGLDSATVTRLATYRGVSGRRAPNIFKVCPLGSEAWETLEAALIAEGRNKRLDEPLRPEHETLLAQVRSNPEVIRAGQQYDGLLVVLSALFRPE